MKSQTLKKVVLMRVAQQIPEKDIGNLKTIFQKLDKNGNGLISLSEMIAGMKEFTKLGIINLNEEKTTRLFNAIDVNRSGEIDYTEFIASFMGAKLETDHKYLKNTFAQFDKNGDGTISREELKQVLYGDANSMQND